MNKALILLIVISTTVIIMTGSGSENCRTISGFVLPHHDLARDLISGSIKELKAIKPELKYIVVLSPNHFRPRSETFTTTKILKNFPIAEEKIDLIKNNYPQLVTDEKLLNGEHGLYIPMSYLAQYYPGAQFVPIAVAPYYTTEKLNLMASILAKVLPEQTLFVASTDFSHKHLQNQALIFDRQTIDVIKNFNYRKLLSFGDDNLDSPAAMAVVMKIMQIRNTTQWETRNESHGALITGNPLLAGTSYVTGVFAAESCKR